MLSGIRIVNYRVFAELQVEGLCRLNLIVGENNVGKSAFLEAVWLLVNNGDKEAALDILALRGETIRSGLHLEAPKDYVRSPLSTLTPWPPAGKGVEFRFSVRQQPDSLGAEMADVSVSFRDYASGVIEYCRYVDMTDLFGVAEDGGRSISGIVEKFSHDSLLSGRQFQPKRGDNVFVPAAGLANQTVQDFWDRITLTAHEDDVDQALQLLEPSVQRLSMTSSGPVVKLQKAPAPVPLRRLGDGMSRLFALALAMVNAKGGVMLIDEIETGLHRSALNRMWPFLFTLAERFDVQVFATTHSWDCIAAFAAAAKATPENDGALVRLERRNDAIVAVHYDEAQLAVAAENGIEVR